jgi:chromosome segregation ATPase
MDDNVYKMFFVQKLEAQTIEFMRRYLDAETNRSLLEVSLKEMEAKYDESQKQVEVQNDIMKQAAFSIEKQTMDSGNLKSLVERHEKELEDKNNIIAELHYKIKDANDNIEELKRQLTQIDMFKQEINRQKQELADMYQELQTVNTELEKYVIKIKPKQKTKLEIVKDDDF